MRINTFSEVSPLNLHANQLLKAPLRNTEENSVPYPQSNHPRVVPRNARQSLKFLGEFWNNASHYLDLVELCTKNISKPSKACKKG